jgi:hypothetical protein
MKIRTALFAAIATLVLTIANVSFMAAQQMNGAPNRTGRSAAVILQCRNYGGQQDVSKNPDIINITQQIIPKGKTLYWKSTDGDSGSVVLDKALAPGGKVGVNGKAGQSYTCSAWMNK